MGTLREALESAYDGQADDAPTSDTAPPEPSSGGVSTESGAAEASTSATPEPTEAAPTKPEPTTDATGRDEKGKFLPRAKVAPAAKAPTPAPTPSAMARGQNGQPIAAATPKATPEAPKAPQSWKATEREVWAKLPPDAQAIVARREREVAQSLQDAAPARQVVAKLQEVVGPYSGLIRSQGWEPLALAENLFQTYGALHTSPPAQKAGLIANLISTFGIDPGMVAAHLQGQPVQQQPQAFDPNQLAQHLEQRILGRFEQQRASVISRQAESELAEFEAAHEFMDDVREHMAKLLESGLADDYADAYSKAVSLHPEVSKVMQQRTEAERAKAMQASTSRSKVAASSLRSTPAGPSGGPQPTDLRSILERTWDQKAGQSR